MFYCYSASKVQIARAKASNPREYLSRLRLACSSKLQVPASDVEKNTWFHTCLRFIIRINHPYLSSLISGIVQESNGITPLGFAEHPGLLSQATFHHLRRGGFFGVCLYGGFQKWGYPQMDGWFIMEISLKWMIWGYPHFRKPPYVSYVNMQYSRCLQYTYDIL